jgi:hypothetical protein
MRPYRPDAVIGSALSFIADTILQQSAIAAAREFPACRGPACSIHDDPGCNAGSNSLGNPMIMMVVVPVMVPGSVCLGGADDSNLECCSGDEHGENFVLFHWFSS